MEELIAEIRGFAEKVKPELLAEYLGGTLLGELADVEWYESFTEQELAVIVKFLRGFLADSEGM